jgi:hypothetical protein
VYVKSDKQLANVLALVSRMASNRVGVSAQFDDLRAGEFWGASSNTHATGTSGSQLFAYDMNVVAWDSATKVMAEAGGSHHRVFRRTHLRRREVLFETFRVWLENDGSLRTVGNCSSAIPTPSAIDCTALSNEPAVRWGDLAMSPNCVWHSRFIGASCGRRRTSTGHLRPDEAFVQFCCQNMNLASQLGVGLQLELLCPEVMVRLGLLEGRLAILADHHERGQEDRLERHHQRQCRPRTALQEQHPHSE